MAQHVLRQLIDYEPGVSLSRHEKMSADELVAIVKKIESKLAHYRRQRGKATKLIEGMKLKYGRNISDAHEHHAVEYDTGLYMRPDEVMLIDNASIVKTLIVSKLASYGETKIEGCEGE